VNQSPAGQITVTSVVKDLAVGSRLDLIAGLTVRCPAASNCSCSRPGHPAPG
jgi:hypothetical protein